MYRAGGAATTISGPAAAPARPVTSRPASAAIDLCLAAEGSLDAYYEKGLNAWDHAAGGLVASEAGLLVTGLSGAAAGPDMVVAAPPALHKGLHDRLVELGADKGP